MKHAGWVGIGFFGVVSSFACSSASTVRMSNGQTAEPNHNIPIPTEQEEPTTEDPTEDACPLLSRPGCTPNHQYGGTLDHFVDVECSALFEIRRELPLSSAPRRLARGIVLLEKPARTKGGLPRLSTFDYTRETSKEEKLVLNPPPIELRGVFYDEESPVLLGKARCGSALCRDFSLWRLQCRGSCRMLGHFRFQLPDELENAPNLPAGMRADVVHAVEAVKREERRAWCMRSSAGCRGELHDESPAPVLAGTLPDKQNVRLALEDTKDGVYLSRFQNGREVEKRLLISPKRDQPMGPIHLSAPVPIPSGYVALLETSSALVFGALIRLREDGSMTGAPVLTATMDQGEWFAGCVDSLCLIAVLDGAVAETPVGRVIRVTDIVPPPCESQTSVNDRY